jgi:outer membrane protein OmpA-like peptidoglycan-associated protein
MTVELKAYTDCRASMAYNQELSDKRAKASAEYIKARISKPTRIYGKGYGETKLISGCACEGKVVSTCSEEEFQKDRRTEFIIIRKTPPVELPLLTDEH